MMRFSKQLLSIMLCVVLLLSALPVGAVPSNCTDPAKILNEAYALEDGMSLEYGATLTGIITTIITPYDPQYKNLTVVIKVSGYEQMPMRCYRMKGEGADTLAVGDTITVSGTIANYNGTIEFRQGCQLLESDSQVPTDTLIVSGTATFQTWEDAFDGFGAQFVPADDGTVTVNITACDPGFYLDVYADGEWIDDYFGTAPEQIRIDVYRGVTYDFELFTATADTGDVFLWEYALGSVSFDITADVAAGNPGDNSGSNMTVKVIAPDEWQECYVYSWNPEIFASWPGTKLIAGADGTYSFELSEAVEGMVINNGHNTIGDIFMTYDITDLVFTAGASATITIGEVAYDNRHTYTLDIDGGNSGSPGTGIQGLDSIAIVGSGLPGITNWDPADPAGDMTELSGCVFTKELVFDAAAEVVFKFVGNDMWDDQWIFGDNFSVPFDTTVRLERGPYSTDMTLDVHGPCTLVFYLDLSFGPDNPLLTVMMDAPVGSRSLYVQVPDSWPWVCAYSWDYDGSVLLGPWPGTQLTKNGQWYVGELPGNVTNLILSSGTQLTDELCLEAGRDVWIVVGDQLDDNGKNLSVISYSGEPVYRVVGNAYWMGNWDPASDLGLMEQTAPGVYCKTFENVPAGNYEFKITANGSWSQSWGDGYGNNYRFTLDRKTDLTVTFTPMNGKISVDYETVIPGDINGDSKRNVADVSKLYAHIRGTITLTDPNVLSLADLSGDGKLNVADVSKLYAYVRGVSAEAIVDSAYELAEGEKLPRTVTLTGTVTDILEPYHPQYNGITLIMQISGREDKPIICTRLMGQDAASVEVNDTVTVTGTLQNYFGTVEFAEGCSLDKWVHALTPEELQAAAVEAAYALKENTSMDYPETLIGKIISVDQAYSAAFPYVSITIAVPGKEDKPIGCYRLVGEDIRWIREGDTVTVTGTLRNYYGKVEFAPGCQLDNYFPGSAVETDPLRIVDQAYMMPEGSQMAYDVTLSGKVISVDNAYSPEYKNITVTIAVRGREDKPIVCYRLKGDGVEKIVRGDTITVTGRLKNYYGAIEFDTGCQLIKHSYA